MRIKNITTSIALCFFGITIGSLITFQWNNMANFLAAKGGIPLVSILLIISLSILISIVIVNVTLSYSTKALKFKDNMIKTLREEKDARSAAIEFIDKAAPYIRAI